MSEKNWKNELPKVIVDYKQLYKSEENAGIHDIKSIQADMANKIGKVESIEDYAANLKTALDLLCEENEQRALIDIKTNKAEYEHTKSGLKRFYMLIDNGIRPEDAYQNVLNKTKSKFK